MSPSSFGWSQWSRPQLAVTLRLIGKDDGPALQPLLRRVTTIGRDAGNDIVVEQPYVSARHARIEIRGQLCILVDLCSTNGITLNGQKVGDPGKRCEFAIRHGDRLKFDSVEYEVLFDGAAQSEPPPPPLPSPPPPAAISPLLVRCRKCGKDLSAKADSDGRARELAEVAHYRCASADCLPFDPKCAGKTVGPYRLLKLLGLGGMGKVHLVYDERTARIWALKQMKDGNARDLAARFRRGDRTHLQVAHRNIVRWVDKGEDPANGTYLVSEYVEGGELGRSVIAGKCLQPQVAVPLMCAMLEGLQHLHERKIIHRDLKPQNILLDRPLFADDGTLSSPLPTPKIADFDLAKMLSLDATVITESNTRMGTPQFMPPEQVLNAKRAQEPADIYSAGATLYYLLTGRFPFDFPPRGGAPQQPSAEQLAGIHLHDASFIDALGQREREREYALNPTRLIIDNEPTPIQERDSAVPDRLAEAVDKAVKKSPGDRFQTAAEFRKALEQAR